MRCHFAPIDCLPVLLSFFGFDPGTTRVEGCVRHTRVCACVSPAVHIFQKFESLKTESLLRNSGSRHTDPLSSLTATVFKQQVTAVSGVGLSSDFAHVFCCVLLRWSGVLQKSRQAML